MSIIIISPHFDDAALSAWTILDNFGKKKDIKLLTVCGGIPKVEYNVSSADIKCGFSTASEAAITRIKEDLNFCSTLNIKPIHLDEFDYPYTGRKKRETIISKINTYIKDNDIVYAPLGIGNHPDHIVVRDAILNISLSKNINLFLYFDFPYASTVNISKSYVKDLGLNDSIQKKLLKNEMVFKNILTDTQLNKKINNLTIYNSQIKMLESNYPKLMQKPGILNIEYFMEVKKID